MACMPCTFLLHTLCTFQARSKHATYVFFFALKSYVCFLLVVCGVCTDHLHFVHELSYILCKLCLLLVQALFTPCARSCMPVQAPSIQYVRAVVILLYHIYFTFLNLRSVLSPSKPRASYPTCPMHALCTPFARPKHARSMQGVFSFFALCPMYITILK